MLERAADVADLELEHQGLADDLATKINRWRVVKFARALIDETLRDFERTRQPAVLAAASDIFRRVTGERYVRIVQDGSDEKLAVIDASGGRRRPGQLSRGTAELLYLCVRLGLAGEFPNRAEPLPLVMDDVLVNFDSSRARSMAIELRAFAERHQVLLFTCHSFTRDLFRSLDASVRIEELVPQGLVAT